MGYGTWLQQGNSMKKKLGTNKKLELKKLKVTKLESREAPEVSEDSIIDGSYAAESDSRSISYTRESYTVTWSLSRGQ